MPFDRLSFPEGAPVGSDASQLHQEVLKLTARHFRRFVRLSPGEYDLTPRVWETSNYTHHLTVHDNDTAIYAMEPTHEDSAVMEVGLTQQQFEPGARVFKMPEDRRFAVIMAPALDRIIHVYEIITYAD